MKKWMLVVGIVVAVAVILIVVGLSNLGPIIKRAVNTYGPRMTQTPLHVNEIDVSLLSGKARLKGFLLGNPKGFKSSEAMKVESIQLVLDTGSLTGDTVVIRKIEVIAPELTYEVSPKGNNFQTILENLKRSMGTEESSREAGKEEKGHGKKLLIQDFVLRKGKVRLAVTGPVGKAVTASLPEIHLTNIGGKQGGISPSEAFARVLEAVYAELEGPSVKGVLDQGLRALGGSLEEATGASDKALQKKMEDVTERVKGLLRK